MLKNTFFIAIVSYGLLSCQYKTQADLIVYNAKIFTVDTAFSKAEALAVKNGKIIATGNSLDILKDYDAKEKTDAQGKFIYPGFIDAHAHFYHYGLGLGTADLVGTRSWDQIIEKIKRFATENKEGWLMGRGWDQNQWPVKEFPGNDSLNVLFPDRPVILQRVDGHAVIVNQKALEIAGIKPGATIAGGLVETRNGKLTGVLIDNAIGLVFSKIPVPDFAQVKAALMAAQKNCFAVGLTTVDDCGLSANEIQFIDSLQKSGDLKMRVYAMLSDAKSNYEFAFRTGKIKTDRLNMRAFKVYADGALGSRGACLLQPYTDKPGWKGFLLSSAAHYDSVAALLLEKGFQMCTHAIGDSGNRIILQTYARHLKGKNDLRWRIEHAQVINEKDFSIFAENNIIPSVQPTHATSDMYWAAERLGPDRVKGAYAFKQLLDQNGWIPLGTDFPVEDISPFKTFFAAVARKDAKGWPAGGFQPENALSREAALKGMTLWAAKANFEEKEKGSLEIGKLADFILLDQDLLTSPENKLLETHVLATYVNGEKVH